MVNETRNDIRRNGIQLFKQDLEVNVQSTAKFVDKKDIKGVGSKKNKAFI